MTLASTLTQLCTLQAGLRITDPIAANVKVAYPFPPSRTNTLPDMPCWVNAWSLHDTLSWGDLRVERYTVTSQLFIRDADQARAAAIATSFGEAFISAWDSVGGDLNGTTLGVELRGREPTMGMLEWGGQSYPGISVLVDVDVAIPGSGLFVDGVITAMQTWTLATFPTWQIDPSTWQPTDAAPGIYWHYVTLPAAVVNEFLSFDVTWQEAILAARIIAPSSIGRDLRARDLAAALGHVELDGIALPDGSWLWPRTIRATPDLDARSRSQVQFDARFVLDETLPGVPGGVFGQAILFATINSPGYISRGPTRTATPVTVSLQ